MTTIIFNGPSQAIARSVGGTSDIVPYIGENFFSLSSINSNIFLTPSIGRTYVITGFTMTLAQAYSSTASEFGIWTPNKATGTQIFSGMLQNNLATGNDNSYRIFQQLDISLIGDAFEIGLTNFPPGHIVYLTVSGFFIDNFSPLPIPFNAPRQDLLKYWFAADIGAFSDINSLTPATNGDKVAFWKNIAPNGWGDGFQNINANRPTFFTGGLNNLPFIKFNKDNIEHFQDVAFITPPGVSEATEFTVAFVLENIDISKNPGLIGAVGALNGGKSKLIFRTNEGSQIEFTKSQFNLGNVTSPIKLIAHPSTNGSGTPIRFILNNSGLLSSNNSTTNLNSTASNSLHLFRNTPTNSFDGRCYELMIWQVRLNDTEMLEVSNYLDQKYGL